MIPTEHQEQAAVIQWWSHYSRTRGIDERLLMAIPNGFNKSPASAAKAKREGLRAGVPDLFLAMPKITHLGVSCGLWVEMKRVKGGVQSPAQKEYAKLLESVGYTVRLAKGADEAVADIADYIEG